MDTQIIHESSRSHFTMLPNMMDDSDLDPYEFRLLAHYYRLGSGSYESLRKTAERCNMSHPTVLRARQGLADKGWVRLIQPDEPGHSTTILVLDRWQENREKYSDDGSVVYRDGSQFTKSGSQIEHKNNKKKEDPLYPPNGDGAEKNGNEKVERVITIPSASTPTEPEAVSVAAEILPLPVPGHDTEAFRQKWAEWQAYRREKRCPLKPTTAYKQLTMLMKYAEPVAIAMLEQSMLNGWQGIFELKNTRPDPPKPRPWTPLGYNEQEQPRANGAARPWTPLGG